MRDGSVEHTPDRYRLRGRLLRWGMFLLAVCPLPVAFLADWDASGNVASVVSTCIGMCSLLLQHAADARSGRGGRAGAPDGAGGPAAPSPGSTTGPGATGDARAAGPPEGAGEGRRLSTVKRGDAAAPAGGATPAPGSAGTMPGSPDPAPVPPGPYINITGNHGPVVLNNGHRSRHRVSMRYAGGSVRHNPGLALGYVGAVVALVVLCVWGLAPLRNRDTGEPGAAAPPAPAPSLPGPASTPPSPTPSSAPSSAAPTTPPAPPAVEPPVPPPTSPPAASPVPNDSLQCGAWKPDHGVTYRTCIGESGGRLVLAAHYQADPGAGTEGKRMWLWLVRKSDMDKSQPRVCPRPIAAEQHLCGPLKVSAPAAGEYTAAGGISDDPASHPGPYVAEGYYGMQSGPMYWRGDD
ncbi:hypothetical protein ABT218_05040 [Streptomyces sp. NPDC001455]|uniref:hypothetical protein n=1 Tax=Streptomyces sp. NPDC001455 TaxID=3154518 RepID=UPI0033324526